MDKVFNNKTRVSATILVSFVFIINVQAGLDFFLRPSIFVSAYELTGIPGQVAIAGTGLLFIMWNIPYAFALWNPFKNLTSLIQAILMQLIGCIGETIILFRYPHEQHSILTTSIQRFILFDTIGLGLLLIAGLLIWRKRDTA